MKKQPKKKAARKKPAKRVAKKRPSRKKPSRTKPSRTKPSRPRPKRPRKARRRRVTVQLVPVTGPVGKPVLSESRRDQIRWWNRDAIDHTLQFNIWIFTEPAGDIMVPAGKKSGWLTIDPNVVIGTYSYAIIPAFEEQGPPDPPEVEADS